VAFSGPSPARSALAGLLWAATIVGAGVVGYHWGFENRPSEPNRIVPVTVEVWVPRAKHGHVKTLTTYVFVPAKHGGR
jgi:hypothetical protein